MNKRTYITPETELLSTETSLMLAASLTFSGDGGSTTVNSEDNPVSNADDVLSRLLEY